MGLGVSETRANRLELLVPRLIIDEVLSPFIGFYERD